MGWRKCGPAVRNVIDRPALADARAGFELPPLIGTNEAAAESVKEWHELGALVGYWLVGAHAAASLWHHYVQNDTTLVRMLPRRRDSRPRS